MNGLDSEIAFKDEEPEREESVPPTPITTCDMEVIIRGWEEKFERITECLREVQLASERANSDMCLVSQEARAQGQEQERRLETMHEGLKDLLQKLRPRGPQIHPTWTLSRRARHMVYRLECAQNLGFSHRQWAKMRPWSLNTARCRTSGVRAPRIMETVWKRIWDLRAAHCRTSGVRAQGITTIFGKRATRCRTPVVHAQGIT